MVRLFLAVAAAVGLTMATAAQDLPPLPKGPSPDFGLATAMEKDGAVVVRFTSRGAHNKVLEVEQDGKKVTQIVVELAWVDSADVKVDGKDFAVLGADGKAIDPKDLLKRLAKPTQVAVFRIGPKVEPKPDPFYLRMLREDVVVFVAPYAKFLPAPRKE